MKAAGLGDGRHLLHVHIPVCVDRFVEDGASRCGGNRVLASMLMSSSWNSTSLASGAGAVPGLNLPGLCPMKPTGVIVSSSSDEEDSLTGSWLYRPLPR